MAEESNKVLIVQWECQVRPFLLFFVMGIPAPHSSNPISAKMGFCHSYLVATTLFVCLQPKIIAT